MGSCWAHPRTLVFGSDTVCTHRFQLSYAPDDHLSTATTHPDYPVGSLTLLSTTLTITLLTPPRTTCCHVHNSQRVNTMHYSCDWKLSTLVPRSPSHTRFGSLQTRSVPKEQANL